MQRTEQIIAANGGWSDDESDNDDCGRSDHLQRAPRKEVQRRSRLTFDTEPRVLFRDDSTEGSSPLRRAMHDPSNDLMIGAGLMR